ncbi:MAG TPA: glycosyltransferase family 2 protein [candidate division Zixibacteria bacterium]
MVKNLLVIIPAYNAASTISGLIEKLSLHVEKGNMVVVDDGSEDHTTDLAEKAGVLVLCHVKNLGKGEALKTGFVYAIKKDYQAVITIDADLQHDPGFIPDFVAKSQEAGDVLIGTRERNLRNMPLARWFTNHLSSVIISIFSGQSIRDSQSGYRWISVKVLKRVKLASERYDLEPELLIKSSRLGFRIKDVFISTIYTQGKSYINPLVDTGRFIRLMWRSLWW